VRDTATTGYLVRKDLVEASGAAMSRTQPDVLFTINDSGNDAILYATDIEGRDRGAWVVDGATDGDWESIAVGPCGSAAGSTAWCVYIGDTGDNSARYDARAIFRVHEPDVEERRERGTIPSDKLVYATRTGRATWKRCMSPPMARPTSSASARA